MAVNQYYPQPPAPPGAPRDADSQPQSPPPVIDPGPGGVVCVPVRQRAPVPARSAGGECCDPRQTVLAAFANAEAMAQQQEALRPNKIIGIGQTNPASTLATGDTTFTATLPEQNVVCWLAASAADFANWTASECSFNNYDFLTGAPVPLDIFNLEINRRDKAIPLTGRVWKSAVSISITVKNISGSASLFRNFAMGVIDPECRPMGKTEPMPEAMRVWGFAGFTHWFRDVWSRVFG